MDLIKLVSIDKYFDKQVLSNFSLNIKKKEIVGILGPSGSGKSTLLRIIAGLEVPDKGEIFIGDNCVYSKNKFVPPEKRNVGLVFQDLALWPHMSVKKHLNFVLEIRGISKDKREKEIRKILNLVNLSEYIKSYPSQLSGGEKQRLAIARVLAQNPKILLLDEPFSNLDPILKKELKKYLVDMQKNLRMALVYVTHNPAEISDIANKIVIIREGKIIQIGGPTEIYKNPKNSFVRKFLEI